MHIFRLITFALHFALFAGRAGAAAPTFETLQAFSQGPAVPESGELAADSNGYLWGVTSNGGAHFCGAIYKVKVDGSAWQIVHSFPEVPSSGEPKVGLMYDGEGFMWGVSAGRRLSFGSVFKVDVQTGEVTTVFEFTGPVGEFRGYEPNAVLVDDGSGNLWGTTQGGQRVYASDPGPVPGNVFKINRATGAYSIVAEFGDLDGTRSPFGSLVKDESGFFWGTSAHGGSSRFGSIFKVDPSSGELTCVAEFKGGSGENRGGAPMSALLNVGSGVFWGTTANGGLYGHGTVFTFDSKTGSITTVIDFTGDGATNRGATPEAGLSIDGAGSLWGVTKEGGLENRGTVFKIDPGTKVLTTVAEFPKSSNVGAFPRARLVANGAGYFLGITPSGVYRVNIATGEMNSVLRFGGDGPDHRGAFPQASIVSGSAGTLWSTTSRGGRFGCGTVFKIAERTGELTTVAEFSGVSGVQKGDSPSVVMRDGAGAIWGITRGGGSADLGTIFKLDSISGALATVIEFGGAIEGRDPNPTLVRDGKGYLWGTTRFGTKSLGTVFKVNEVSGEFSTVFEFPLGTNLGFPSGNLVIDGSGFIWGTTNSGGAANDGTLFKVNIATGELTTVWEFEYSVGGGREPEGLMSNGKGILFGMTGVGGMKKGGTVFRFDTRSGALATLYEFDLFADDNGHSPNGSLVGDRDWLWGVTRGGGDHGFGTVFKIHGDTGELTTVVSFTGTGGQDRAGSSPTGPLLLHTDGSIYGSTFGGGPSGGGTIFRIRGAVPRHLAQSVVHRAGPRGSGSAVPGEPEGTTFVSAGEPAVDRQSAAFLATIRNPEGKQASAIFGGNAIVARAGQAAPCAEPAKFKSFDEPLVSPAGVAFGAKLSDGRSGIWTTAFTGELQVVELSKSAAPGLPDTKIASIMSYSLRGAEIVALLKLQRGPGGVTSANDMTLTRYVNGNESRLLSKGQGIPVGDANPQPLLSLSAFTPSPLAPGQDRGHVEGVVGAKGTVRLSDRSLREVVLRGRADGTVEVVEMSSSAVKNSPAFIARSFGLPAVGGTEGLAYLATAHARAATRDQAIATDLLENESDDQPLEIVEGEQPAPGAEPATFLAMSDPVVNDQQRMAFLASLQGQGITAKNNRGLWWGDAAAGLSLVARLGGFAPDRDGAPSVATFAKIERFGLPDGWDAGPLFIATLTGPRGSMVTSANNRALYGRDSDGKLRELLRTGDELEYAGEMKKVRSFTALSGGKPVGGRRAFTTAGHVAARAVFTDKSTGIIQITVP